jgi:drug/metabolite transporter (DMT)-like permease
MSPSSPPHTISGRWKLGFALSVITALSFGVLPIALKGLLDALDVYTVTWYRFIVAAVILALFIVRPARLKALAIPGWGLVGLIILTSVLMSVNFILYLIGLQFITPSTAQVVIQLAPIFLLLSSLVVYREGFSKIQWGGLAVVLIGQAVFFNQRLGELFSRLTDYTFGVLLIVTAAFSWAVYGLFQKKLLRDFSSSTIILLLYAIGSLIFFPASQPGLVLHLTGIQLLLLAFCALNSLVSYGAFAEALNHWEASRVSAVLATVPIVTVVAVKICAVVLPEIFPSEHLSVMSIVGAVMVVAGSMVSALGKKR